MADVVIVGTGGQARELHAMLEAEEEAWHLLGFLDDSSLAPEEVHGAPVLGGIGWLDSHPDVGVFLGIGAPKTRRQIVDRILAYGPRRFPSLVHQSAWVGPRVALGEGSFICPGVVVTTDATVGDHVLLNFGCTVGHDAVLGHFATVAPGANVAGAVRVGEGSDLGAGASTLQGVALGEWSVVGAGAVVTRDIPPNATAVGVPAKVIKERLAGWHLEGS